LLGIDYLCGAADNRLQRLPPETERLFAQAMLDHPIAENTQEANEQHYELPAEFFELALGPHRKYSCCLYAGDGGSLGEAEARALSETCAHADLYAAVDDLVDKLDRQVVRHKDKLQDHQHTTAKRTLAA
jgi:cyclopropane-fatty-acyl-phospholipid synthase